MTTTRLHELAEHGQSVWVDFLSRRAPRRQKSDDKEERR
jgi:hypothetical protein